MSALELRILENLSPLIGEGAAWEKLVQANAASGIMQSLCWAEFKRKQRVPSFHLGIYQKDVLIGGTIFYSSPKRNGVGILVAPEGPVLPWHDEEVTREALRLIIDYTQSQSKQLGVIAMRIEPRLAPPLIPTLREFGRAPVDLVPKETLYIDVSHSDDAMLVPMKEKGRYNIRLSEREGVKLATDTTGRTISHFHSILTEASQRDSFGLESLLFFEDLASVLCGYGHAKILYAEHEGDALGTLLLVTYGSRATYLYGGITNTKRNLMGGYALQWAAMKMARDAGCTIYDFYGFDQFRAPENNYAKFSQFKSQFGGIVAKFVGAQDYFFLDNLVDAFIKVAGEIQPEQQPAGATK